MSFKISARTILQLGSELISSDAVAFYELIKNAFDAGSETVTVKVNTELEHSVYVDLCNRLDEIEDEELDEDEDEELEDIRNEALAALGKSDYARELRERLNDAEDPNQIREALSEANYIEISDTGEGMSHQDLTDVYLLIGTRNRLIQKNDPKRPAGAKPILGEKGIGRLSAMRLGELLQVRTCRSSDKRWNELFIDWRRFSHDSDELLEDIAVEPEFAEVKESRNESGTVISIAGLRLDWNRDRIKEVVEGQVSRFFDPFQHRRSNVRIFWNGERIRPERLQKYLLESAHAYCEAEFTTDGITPALRGSIDYTLRKKEMVFSVEEEGLDSVTSNTALKVLKSLGPFKMRVYWHNRRLFNEMYDSEEREVIKKAQSAWSGGLMLFRDGYRVLPYGGPDDDWLDLDRKALASQGYKVNRRQLIGKVEIGAADNPKLLDQTNREGLSECPEKEVLVVLLKHVLEGKFRGFLYEVDKKHRALEPVDLSQLDEGIEREERKLLRALKAIRQKCPNLDTSGPVISTVRRQLFFRVSDN